MTENSIYLVSGKIQKRKIQTGSLRQEWLGTCEGDDDEKNEFLDV
jgi:hypothetical protein